ncbi:type II CAAX prenyl endopeptidase Rce1 family protein [Hahella sp. HN01]|uniref:CPBP family glutamic-type intramembrane protease n=1 Tax=Hahella sp. HN01 TaxID=2847262 RepID=UPI001C1EC697|nr:CPBP family glutamic-type intramembrane protease [Hahella sp. HN01]MBU6951759.1 CPBP family intramembrane metalloprotease [Hahella sp. HN01]
MKVVLSLLLGVFFYAGSAFGATPDFADFEKEVTRLYQKEVAPLSSLDTSTFKRAEDLIALCQFIENATYLEDLYIEPAEEDYSKCLDELSSRYSSEPVTQLYLLESEYGESLLDKAVELNRIALEDWDATDIAKLYEQLAYSLRYDKEYKAQSVVYAVSAFQKKPSVRLAEVIVDYYAKNNEVEHAKLFAEKIIPMSFSEEERTLAIKIFVKAGLLEEAAKIFSILDEEKRGNLHTLSHARLLAHLKESAALRELMQEKLDSAYHSKSPELSAIWLDYEVESGDEENAVKAYRAFAVGHYSRDPFLLYWFDLATKYPGAAAQLFVENPQVLLYSLCRYLALALAPLCIFLPVHYIGLWRMRRNKFLNSPNEPIFSGWGLAQAWLLLGLVLVVSSVLYEYFYPGATSQKNVMQAPSGNGPNYMVIFVLVMFVSVICVTGRTLRRGIFHSYRHVLLGIVTPLALAVGLLFMTPILCLPDLKLIVIADVDDYIKSTYEAYGLAVSLLLFGVMVPIYEEILCRGVILNATQRYVGFWFANIIQAAIFMSMHSNQSLYPYYFVLGFIAAILYRYIGGLYAPILMHMAVNFIAVTTLVFGVVADNGVKSQALLECEQGVQNAQHEKAFLSCLPAALQGDAEAQGYVADLYLTKKFVVRNLQESYSWYERALEGGDERIRNNFAWLLATSSNSSIRDGKRAIAIAEGIPSEMRNSSVLDTLAAAYASDGRYESAVSLQKSAIEKLKEDNSDAKDVLENMEKQLQLYREGKPIVHEVTL